MEYPRYVYRKALAKREDKSAFDTLLVSSDDDRAQALSDGWSDDVLQALAPKPEPIVVVNDDAAPTREELEAKAVELGLKFDGRTSDRKLGAMIAEALGE